MAPQGVIYNERYLAIGDETLIGPNVCLTAGISGEQTMLSSPVVTIGRKCIIGRGSHIIVTGQSCWATRYKRTVCVHHRREPFL